MEKDRPIIDIDFDIELALAAEIINVICTESNKPDIDLFAEAFYDIYIKP